MQHRLLLSEVNTIKTYKYNSHHMCWAGMKHAIGATLLPLKSLFTKPHGSDPFNWSFQYVIISVFLIEFLIFHTQRIVPCPVEEKLLILRSGKELQNLRCDELWSTNICILFIYFRPSKNITTKATAKAWSNPGNIVSRNLHLPTKAFPSLYIRLVCNRFQCPVSAETKTSSNQ